MISRKDLEGLASLKSEHGILTAYIQLNPRLRFLRQQVEKQHGDVKTHPAQEIGGLVTRLFPDQGYGFIKNANGQEIYFHKNSLPGDDFDRLEIGTGVQWHEEQGEKGPQASTVRIVDKAG